jgi:catechol 2,3-dioxygenase-like lactoylglutathione lyase family enzyme
MGVKIEGLAPLIEVFDMPRSRTFYRDVVGFRVVATSPPRGRDDFDWGLLKLGEVELMLNTAYEAGARPPAPDAERRAGHAGVGLFFGCRDLDAAYTYLRGEGVEVCLQWPAA